MQVHRKIKSIYLITSCLGQYTTTLYNAAFIKRPELSKQGSCGLCKPVEMIKN
jgi:hypothetical protein